MELIRAIISSKICYCYNYYTRYIGTYDGNEYFIKELIRICFSSLDSNCEESDILKTINFFAQKPRDMGYVLEEIK